MPRLADFNVAALSVEQWIGAFQNARLLSADECASYQGRSIERGWSLDLTLDSEVQSEVRILLPDSFPYGRSLIAVSSERFLAWPHIEEDGVICALPLTTSIDPYRPLAVTQFVLNEALEVIKRGRSGSNVEDFRDEFHSYWDRERTENGTPVVSILSDFSSPRTVSVWYGKKMIVVGDSDDKIDSWMDNQYGKAKERRSYERGSLMRLEAALLPYQYPRTASDLRNLVGLFGADTRVALTRQLDTEAGRNLVIIDAPTRNGRALAAVRINRPAMKGRYGRKVDVLQKGFRPGRTPKGLTVSRYLSHAPEPSMLKVKRADPEWVHGRDADSEIFSLKSKRVAIIGVGSIGSFVAEMLAASGVGRMTLVDSETLTFANAGRHLLGVNNEGQFKSHAVAEELRKRFPHLVFNSVTTDGRSFLRESTSISEGYDLILSLAGDWELDCFLNDSYLDEVANCPAGILFGWTEPHAVAGHGVLLAERGSCLLCHFSHEGVPDLKIAKWEQNTMRSEPACGGRFQPYGAVDVMTVNSMLSSFAIDFLQGRVSRNAHRIYASDRERIKSTGGEETEEWTFLRSGVPIDMSISVTRPWLRRETCNHCGNRNAD